MILSSTSQISHHHKVINITMSPTSMSPFSDDLIQVNINCKNPLSRTNLVLDRGKSEITEYSQISARPPKDRQFHPRKGLPVCGGLHLSGSTNKNFRIDFCPLIIANNTYRSDDAEHEEIECF